jgi:hypothetical protein
MTDQTPPEPMKTPRAPAHTSPADQAALGWLAGHDPGDGKGAIGETTEGDEFTRSVVVDAFTAGVADGVRLLGKGTGLLVEAAALFRAYEVHHRAKIIPGAVGPGPRDALAKAERNSEMAARIEAFLLDPSTPKDRLAGFALSLVQDMEEQGGAQAFDFDHDAAGASSYTRLRDVLNERVRAFPSLLSVGELAAVQGFDAPTLTLVVNGTEYRTTSTSVRGRIGGCPIRAEWDGVTDLRVHIDTPGYEPPPAPPVEYGVAGAPGPILEPVPTSGGLFPGDPGYRAPDPTHDCCEVPRVPVPGVYSPDQGGES